MRWWWGLLCTRPKRWVDFYSAGSLESPLLDMGNPKIPSQQKLIRRCTMTFFTNRSLKFSWNPFTGFRGVEDRHSSSSHITEIEKGHCLIYAKEAGDI
jgi:hypothetical protein